MKKKLLLLTALVFTLMIVFALSISAADLITSESDEFGTVNVVEGMTSTSADTTARVVLKNADSTYSTFYTYYIYPTLNWRKGMTGANFTQLNEALGTEYQLNSVIRLEILYDCEYHELDSNIYENLKEIHFPSNSKITQIRRYYSYVGVLEKINIPCSVTVIDQNAFRGCTGLKEVTFDEDSQVTTITKEAFSGCSSLTEITLPDSVTTVGDYAFWNCSSLTTMRYGANLQTFGTRATSHTTVFYISGTTMKDYTGTMDINYFGDTRTPTVATIFFTGTYDEAAAFKAKSTHTASIDGTGGLKNATLVEWDSGKTDATYISENTAWIIVYGYNTCNAFNNGKHEVTQLNSCVSSCSVCENKVINHDVNAEKITITYRTFDSVGTKTVACTNEGCTHGSTEDAPALFTCLGYSAPEHGTGGIAIGFTVNNEAIEEYEAITGTTVKYGVFAILKDRLGDKNIFAEDGALAEGAIAAEISNHQFALIELKIVGFEEEHKDIKLAMGAFVAVDNGETTEYSYMQGGTPNEGEKYYFVSYNDIVKPSTSTDTPTTDTGVTE